MSEEDAFLARIRAEPDDDTARLVYADWLQDHDQDDRAEFIRVQCELAILDAYPTRTALELTGQGWKQDLLRRRERELFEADDARTLDWFGLPQPWARIVRLKKFDPPCVFQFPEQVTLRMVRQIVEATSYPYAVVRRGFIEQLSLSADAWYAYGEEVRARCPVTSVELSSRPRLAEFNRDWVTRDGKNLQAVRGIVAGQFVEPPPIYEGDDPIYYMLEARWKGVTFFLPDQWLNIRPEGDYRPPPYGSIPPPTPADSPSLP